MSDDDAPPPAAAGAPASNSNTSGDGAAALPTGVGGDSIAKVLRSKGPVVTCVLLRHMGSTGKDTKPHPVISRKAAETAAAALNLDGGSRMSAVPAAAAASAAAAAAAAKDAGAAAANKKKGSPTPPPSPRQHHHHHHHHREVLTELIEEIQVDTTPSAQGVPKALGGPFSFIGQYADEGVVLMKRADQLDDLDDLDDFSVKQLVALCRDSPDVDYDARTMLEKADLVDALRAAQLPVNPHRLQPPFDREVVRGDILVLKVAAAADDDDDEADANPDADENPDEAMAKALADFKRMADVSNDDFFLSYTKEEWVTFAARTDVVAPKIEAFEDEEAEGDDDEEEEEDEDEEEEEDDDDDEDFEAGDEDELDEKDKPALLNLLLGQVIKKFRENNGRGPDSEELLELRRQVAGKLGIQLEESVVAKRPAEGDGEKDEHEHSPKKVKFTGEEGGADGVPADADDSKPPASSSGEGDGDKKGAAE